MMVNSGCGTIRVEDATRVFRMLYNPAKVVLVAAIVGMTMFMALHLAGPLPILSDTGKVGSITMPVASKDEEDREVERQASALLAEFEERYGPARPADVHPLP